MTATPNNPVPGLPGLTGLTVIARGGYSTVYRARQESMGREIALKIDTRTLDEERDRRRFLREAEAAGRMSGHPHIVHVYDAGVTPDNHPYLVMELCTGGSYASKIKKDGPLPATEARDLGVKIADALDAAHRAGILHRDVKPGNILVNRYGVAGLADFGLAAVFDASRDMSVTVEALTPAYAAPEVFRLERPTYSCDIYSLAATLYALLSGRPPRWPDTGSPSPVQMVMMHNEPIPDIRGVSAEFLDVLRKAMSTDPTRRHGSAAEFRDALVSVRVLKGSEHGADGVSTAMISPAAPRQATPIGHSVSGAPAMPRSVSAGPVHVGVASISNHPGSGAPPQFAAQSSSPPWLAQQHSFSSTRPPAPGSRRRPALVGVLVGLIAVFVALSVIASVLVAKHHDSPDRTANTPNANTSVPGQNDECQLTTKQVSCPTKPQCFSAIKVDGANNATADEVDCTERHLWETFAISELPEQISSADYPGIKSEPYIKALCSTDTLQAALGGASTSGWRVDVLPPTRADLATGDRAFQCVAGKKSGLTKSYFARRKQG